MTFIASVHIRCCARIPARRANTDEIDDGALLREVHYFRTLDEVQDYVADFGHARRHQVAP
jgi:hypothetical protein